MFLDIIKPLKYVLFLNKQERVGESKHPIYIITISNFPNGIFELGNIFNECSDLTRFSLFLNKIRVLVYLDFFFFHMM